MKDDGNMKKIVFIIIMSAAWAVNAFAAFTLTATDIVIQDLTVDKSNFFITMKATTSSGEYEVAFDVWPNTHSAIGKFSADDKTISYINSYLHKVKANGEAVDMWYECQPESEISLSIDSIGGGICTLSGTIEASRKGTMYTYHITPVEFAYSEKEVPQPEEDPYRFEPSTPTDIDFTADVVHFRPREGYIEVTLNAMADERYDWIELRLLSDTLAMPAGEYIIDASGEAGTLSASKGYIGSQNDDPCYVAIRGDKEDWGSYTPYYLESGHIDVAYNERGDTIVMSGEATSHHGTHVRIQARSYNMLYVAEEDKPKPEKKTLAIDTVQITYRSDISDSIANLFHYTFNFFCSMDDYPNVLVDAVLSRPMELVAGTYTMAEEQLSGVTLFQNQEDFNSFFFGGEPYVIDSATLVLSAGEGDAWQYAMRITDTIGSEYTFAFAQAPHIVLYPQPSEETDPKDKPYIDEQQQVVTVRVALDSMVWKSETVEKDGILDIALTQREADVNGLRAYLHLGMYTSLAYPAAGTYPVEDSEAEGTFSASLGRYGNVLIPCYLLLMDEDGWAHQIWYITAGDITLSYSESGQPILSGECTTYFGSTIVFAYSAEGEGIENVGRDEVRSTKVLRDGQLYIIFGDKIYNAQGQLLKYKAIL